MYKIVLSNKCGGDGYGVQYIDKEDITMEDLAEIDWILDDGDVINIYKEESK